MGALEIGDEVGRSIAGKASAQIRHDKVSRCVKLSSWTKKNTPGSRRVCVSDGIALVEV